MKNRSHFPGLEGEFTLYDKYGKVKDKYPLEPIQLGKGEISIKVLKADGTIREERTFPMKSFVRNLVRMLHAGYEQDVVSAQYQLKAIDGTLANIQQMDVVAAINDDAYGIIVGDNTTGSGYEPSIRADIRQTDWTLRRAIPEGVGAGQLTHSVTTTSNLVSAEGKFTVTRSFDNGSGGTITVGEIGLAGAEGGKNYLICRDVDDEVIYDNGSPITISPLSIDILNTETLQVTYTFSIADNTGLLNNWLLMLYSSITGAGSVSVFAEDLTSSGGGSASVDFYTNPTYKDWRAAAAAEDSGMIFFYQAGAPAMSRSQQFGDYDYIVDLVTYQSQASIDPEDYLEVVTDSLSNQFNTYKVRQGAERLIKNETGSVIKVNTALLYMDGTANTARIAILRVVFSEIALNSLESLKLTLRNTYTCGTEPRAVS